MATLQVGKIKFSNPNNGLGAYIDYNPKINKLTEQIKELKDRIKSLEKRVLNLEDKTR